MAHKQLLCYLVSTALGLFMALTAFIITWKWLSRPETMLEWVVQVSSGLTVGIVVFFFSWGHFQDPPKVD